MKPNLTTLVASHRPVMGGHNHDWTPTGRCMQCRQPILSMRQGTAAASQRTCTPACPSQSVGGADAR